MWPLSLRPSFHHPSHLWVVIEAKVALVACEEEEVDLGTVAILEECSEVTEVAVAWAKMALVEEASWTFDNRWEEEEADVGTWRMDKGKPHQECRDRPY